MMGESCHPEKFGSKVSITIFCHFLNLLAPYLAYVLVHSVATLGQLHTQECSLGVSMEVRSITYWSIWSTQKILIRKKELNHEFKKKEQAPSGSLYCESRIYRTSIKVQLVLKVKID